MAEGVRGVVANYLQVLFTHGAAGDHADGQLLGRFADDHDHRAFELLVARHGPMVLRVCRAVLADPHDVEDAFQAVFLVLARRASSVRSRDSVASWLFGVASRVSARAKVDAARRRKHERLAAESRSGVMTTATEEPTPLLMEELDRLPGRYREALVLCYLEGQSCDDAANQLRRPVGTVKSQLARGRKLLQQRLIRRDVAVPIGLTAAGIASEAVASVPANLMRNTVSCSSRHIAGASMPVASALALAEGVLKSMISHKIGYVLLLGGSLAVVSLVVVKGRSAERPPEQPARAAEQAQEQPMPDPPVVAFRGTLGNVDADPYLMTFALIGLARSQDNAGDHEATLVTFRLAAQVAEKVPNEHLRRLAIMRTAVARGKIGDAGPARATLERFAREARGLGGEARYDLMSMVIDFQFNAGFQDAARANLKAELAYVDAIADERIRDGGIYRLLYNQVHLGDFDGAIRRAEIYKGTKSNIRSSLIQIILNDKMYPGSFPTLQDIRKMLDLAREITYPYPRAMAEAKIAGALARGGDVDGGLILARNIGGEGDTPFDIQGTEVSSALIGIAEAQADAGKVEAAKATIREAIQIVQTMRQRDVMHAERLRHIVEIQTKLGDLEGAKESALLIENDQVEMATVLVAIARVKYKNSDVSSANASLVEALAASKEIRGRANVINDTPGVNADRVVRLIAVAQAETGNVQSALTTVAGHGDETWKSDCLDAIAKAQAGRGDYAGALLTAKLIHNAASVYAAIASAQAKSGDTAGAMTWASKLDDAAKAFALVGIKEGEAIRRTQNPPKGK